ncbi:type IV secretion system effector BspA [Brucellaceae bacterium C25G]
MLFQRRHKLSLREKIRLLLWPSRSFSRSFRYYGKRIMRITASPHAIAAGLAIGVFAAFTPFFGFHFIIAVVLAYLFAGNIAAAALGTTVANPLTLPFIWGGTYELGRLVINGGKVDGATSLNLARALETMQFAEIWTPLIKPMLLGSTILGALFAVLVYGATRVAVTKVRKKQAENLACRQALRHQSKVS